MSIIKLLIVLCLLAIIVSLGAGLFHMMSDQGESKKMVTSLTLRVVLSVALFVLLCIAWWQGLLQPNVFKSQ